MKKYWDDPYMFTFDAKIREIIPGETRVGILFDETYFYPEGGGQPSDRGTIMSYPVLDVQETEERIIHYLPRNPEIENRLKQGQSVCCEIDREYRIHNMRLHSGCHLLFGAARKLFPEVGYAGFNIGEVGNLYLETPRQIRWTDLNEMSQLANEAIVADRQVNAFFVDPQDAKKLKDLAVNMELPKEPVRIIEVDGWDLAACSGTHVRRTIDIGPIKIISRESHKKNVTRIDYAVGKRAVAETVNDERILMDTADFLSTSKEKLGQVVRKMAVDIQTSEKELRKLRGKLVDYRVSELRESAKTIHQTRLIVDAMDYIDSETAKAILTKLLSGSNSLVVAVIGGNDELSIAAGCSPDVKISISQPIVAIAKKYGGGGGGRPNYVTAGGIRWSASSIRDEVEKELSQLL
jgi:alanyl-tRNA synthetase